MKINNRRGSHVGMILSFVIFITFIIFLYSVVKPAVSVGQDKKTIADYLVVKIIGNVSANFTSTSVEINSSRNPVAKCIRLTGFFVLVPEVQFTTVIQNESRNKMEAFYNSIGELVINRTSRNNLFFRIYSSPEFPLITGRETSTGCSSLAQEYYSIGVIKSGTFAFENNLDSLIDYYNDSGDNYENLKTALNVPPGTEFGFGITKSNGIKIDVGDIPPTAEVYAAEIPIQYIDNNVNVQSGFINIRVW
jgi:hypothetical protein